MTHSTQQMGFATRAIHVGSEPSSETGAVIPAISLSTTYKQETVGVHKGFEYSRSDNPNRRALEAQLAALESGDQALAFASGSAATATVLTSLGPGSHVISVNDVYGGTFRYMKRVAGEVQGIDVTFLDLERAEEETIRAAIRPETKLIWIESPTNPTLRLIDITHISRIARSHPSHPLILVDNTFLSPYYQSPLKLGADAVLHSLTKYVNGHSDVVMGAVILKRPSEADGSSPHLEHFSQRVRFLQNAIGAVPSPHDAWLAQRGAKTLQLRMRAHGLNALAVARALERAKEKGLVKDVVYPGLRSHPRFGIAYKISLSEPARRWIDTLRGSHIPTLYEQNPEDDIATNNGENRIAYDPDRDGIPFGGMISFRINGGEKETDRFLANLKFFALAESLGGVESLAEVPEKMTHGSIPPAERAILGIGPDLIRLSVGIEDPEDLVQDVENALKAAILGEESKEFENPEDIPSSLNPEEYASRPDSGATSENGDAQ